MNRFVFFLLGILVIASGGCSFAPKRDLSQLYLGNSRAMIRGVLGKPAASYRHQGHDVDVYAFFQGYNHTQQVMISSGKVMAVLGGSAMVVVVHGIVEHPPVIWELDDLPGDPAALAAYENQQRVNEEEQDLRRAELRAERKAETAAAQQEQAGMRRALAIEKLEPDDLNPKYRTEVRGQTLHFDNHEDADRSRHLVFAVNYDAEQKLASVAFLTGMTRASGDAFGRGPETWFTQRGKFPLQDIRQSIFFAPPEQTEPQEAVTSLPALD